MLVMPSRIQISNALKVENLGPAMKKLSTFGRGLPLVTQMQATHLRGHCSPKAQVGEAILRVPKRSPSRQRSHEEAEKPLRNIKNSLNFKQPPKKNQEVALRSKTQANLPSFHPEMALSNSNSGQNSSNWQNMSGGLLRTSISQPTRPKKLGLYRTSEASRADESPRSLTQNDPQFHQRLSLGKPSKNDQKPKGRTGCTTKSLEKHQKPKACHQQTHSKDMLHQTLYTNEKGQKITTTKTKKSFETTPTKTSLIERINEKHLLFSRDLPKLRKT